MTDRFNPRDLKITYGNDILGWVVFDAAARDRHPNRIIQPVFAAGPGAGSDMAHAWLRRQVDGAPKGKLEIVRSGFPAKRGAEANWLVIDAGNRDAIWATARTKDSARDCMRVILTNPEPLPEDFVCHVR